MQEVSHTPEEGQLKVRMLGEFSITYGGKTISENSGRKKKLWWLVEYLLFHRGKDVSPDALIDLLWEEDESDNPQNSLKNLVYRARLLLKELDETVEFIRFEHNSYAWNTQIPCTVDALEMDRSYEKAEYFGLPEEERFALYKRTLYLYQGEFLPKSSFLHWVVVKNAYYQSVYAQCVLRMREMLEARNDFFSVVRLCEHALYYLPLEEPIHQVLLRAYAAVGQQTKALEHYEYMVRQFNKELGVRLHPDTVRVYRDIVRGMHDPEMDLAVIREELREVCAQRGAFFCEYEVFRQIYRLQMRSIARSGSSLYIALISVMANSGVEADPQNLQRILEPLTQTVCRALRKGDVVSRYSSVQLVILMPLESWEDGRNVLRRVTRRFEAAFDMGQAHLVTRLQKIEPFRNADAPLRTIRMDTGK